MARKIWLGMLAITLTFGMTGCGDGANGGGAGGGTGNAPIVSPIDGRWVFADEETIVLVLGNGISRMYFDGVLDHHGTFSTSGNSFIVTDAEGARTATFVLSNNNTLTITAIDEGETFVQVWHRQR